MKIKTATGPLKWYMQALGFKGLTSFWETIYVMPGWEQNRALIRHELCHLEQIRREGRLRFAIGYLWKLVRSGYWANKYEVEARAAEIKPTMEA